MPTYNPYMETHAIQKYQFLEHFLPHPETKKRAKLLSHTALLVYSMVMLVVIGAFHILPNLAPGVLGYASNINVTALLDGTNYLRGDIGLNTLTINPDLSVAAQKKAEHMFENDYWDHIAPDGTAPWDFILGEGYDYRYAGENLAKNFSGSEQVVEAWYKSPSHKENLLNENYDEIGFAVVNGVLEGYETTLVVQLFGKSRAGTEFAAVFEEPTEIQAVPAEEFVPVPSTSELIAQIPEEKVLPAVDVTSATRTITMLVGFFLLGLLLVDIWYTKKKAIPKITGHAFSHVIVLVFTIVGVWFALSPGKVL